MPSFSDLYTRPTATQIKTAILDIADAAGLLVTSWILGDPSERWIEIVARGLDAFTSTIQVQYVRSWFLDLATDPGDPGDLSADQTPRPGWLSALGENWYGTIRRGQTLATGTLALTNVGGSAATFYPLSLTFQSDVAQSDGGYPTYRNSPDPSIYTNPDGSVTVAASATINIPIVAEQIGSYASAQPGHIVVVVTSGSGSFTCTNASPVLGTERETPDAYRARCRTAADQQSPGGPGNAYRRAATTAIDGSALQRWDGSGPVGTTRVYVSADSTLGYVFCFFADNDGPADAIDVASSNANITGIPEGVITDPIGVVPDCVTYQGAAATATTIALSGSCKIKARPGVTALDVKNAIVSALSAAFATFEIGGFDQVAGAGVIYTVDLSGIVRDAFPGIYDVTITTPGTSTTALAIGHVAVLSTVAADWTVTVT